MARWLGGRDSNPDEAKPFRICKLQIRLGHGTHHSHQNQPFVHRMYTEPTVQSRGRVRTQSSCPLCMKTSPIGVRLSSTRACGGACPNSQPWPCEVAWQMGQGASVHRLSIVM